MDLTVEICLVFILSLGRWTRSGGAIRYSKHYASVWYDNVNGCLCVIQNEMDSVCLICAEELRRGRAGVLEVHCKHRFHREVTNLQLLQRMLLLLPISTLALPHPYALVEPPSPPPEDLSTPQLRYPLNLQASHSQISGGHEDRPFQSVCFYP